MCQSFKVSHNGDVFSVTHCGASVSVTTPKGKTVRAMWDGEILQENNNSQLTDEQREAIREKLAQR